MDESRDTALCECTISQDLVDAIFLPKEEILLLLRTMSNEDIENIYSGPE
jgi:hypothetical protein